MIPLISVIIPIYNGERYLCQCIDSILYQSFKDFEIILINDGSSDCSGEICNLYASKYPQINVTHQENLGVNVAREAGVLKAAGEYITFVDADDTLIPNALDILYHYHTQYDLIVCADHSECEISGIEYSRLLLEARIPTSVWSKLIKKTLLLHPNIFPPPYIRIGEDYLINLRIANYTNHIKIINNKIYNYRQHSSSTVHKFKSTIEYEKLFDRELEKSFQTESRLKELASAIFKQRINSLKAIIRKGGRINYQDPYVRQILVESRNNRLYLEAIICLYCRIPLLNKYLIKSIGKWRQIRTSHFNRFS